MGKVRAMSMPVLLGLGMMLTIAPRVHAASPVVQPSRAAVVLQFFDALNHGDDEGAMSVVADSASWIGGSKCPATSPCQGADAVLENAQADIAVHSTFTTTSIGVLGSVVIGQFQVQNDATRAAGLDGLALTFTAQVPQDKITVWLTQPNRADPQTAAFLAGQPVPDGANATPAQAPADPDAFGAVLRFFDAINHGEADAAADNFAPNAFMVGAAPQGLCSVQQPCTSQAAIRDNMNVLVKTPNLCETVTSIETIGSFVTGRVEVRQDNLRHNGIARVVQSFLIQLQQGKILAYFGRNDVADPLTALNLAIAAGTAQPGAPLPTPEPACG